MFIGSINGDTAGTAGATATCKTAVPSIRIADYFTRRQVGHPAGGVVYGHAVGDGLVWRPYLFTVAEKFGSIL